MKIVRGPCHEDIIAVIGQFCILTEVITLCLLYLHTKCSCEIMKNISNKFDQGALVTIIVFGDFCRQSIKLQKIGPTFSSFNPCPSLPSVTTNDSKQYQYLNIVFNSKT